MQWFSFVGLEFHEDTGFWLVEPDVNADTGQPHITVIHIDSIYRAIHLMPAHLEKPKWYFFALFYIILQKKWKKCNLEQIVQIFPIMQFETRKAICNV